LASHPRRPWPEISHKDQFGMTENRKYDKMKKWKLRN